MSAIARLAGMLVLLLAAVAAAAQTKVPSERPLEALVKSALLSFNDANLTGNYTVFHAKLSKPFRQQFTVEKLKAFRGYFIVVAFVIAAIVTPPDVISQLALAVPMCVLYEIGILGSRWFSRVSRNPESDAAEQTKSD